ncbi:MAG: zinc ribbon domain-containing protein [Kiritimatiellaeota bacterium]|nr:zinc ribbon domain-containing protein [Kiritimatiellota bacterium]
MSDIKFTCPHCNQNLKVNDFSVGMKIHCPSCSKQIEIPRPIPPSVEPPNAPPLENKQHRDCPYCREQILVTAIKCKHCGEFLDGSRPKPSSSPPALPQTPAGVSASAIRGVSSRKDRNLQSCKVCQQPMSRNASICPHCGNPRKKPRPGCGCSTVVAGIAGFLAICFAVAVWDSEHKPTAPAQPNPKIQKIAAQNQPQRQPTSVAAEPDWASRLAYWETHFRAQYRPPVVGKIVEVTLMHRPAQVGPFVSISTNSITLRNAKIVVNGNQYLLIKKEIIGLFDRIQLFEADFVSSNAIAKIEEEKYAIKYGMISRRERALAQRTLSNLDSNELDKIDVKTEWQNGWQEGKKKLLVTIQNNSQFEFRGRVRVAGKAVRDITVDSDDVLTDEGIPPDGSIQHALLWFQNPEYIRRFSYEISGSFQAAASDKPAVPYEEVGRYPRPNHTDFFIYTPCLDHASLRKIGEFYKARYRALYALRLLFFIDRAHTARDFPMTDAEVDAWFGEYEFDKAANTTKLRLGHTLYE